MTLSPKFEEMMTGVKFDKTVNLGHILTFIGFLAAIWSSTTMLHARLVLVEEKQKMQETRDAEQDSRSKDTQRDMKDALRDIHLSMERLADKLEARPPRIK